LYVHTESVHQRIGRGPLSLEEHAGPAEVSDSGVAPSASEVHENAVTNVNERQQNENIANTVQNINADEQQDDGVEIAGPSR